MAESGRQREVPLLRRVAFWGVLFLLVAGGAEVACRVYFAAMIGRSVLFYGTPLERAVVGTDEHSPLLRNLRHRRMSGVGNRNNSVRDTDNKLAAYAKYYPHQQRSTYDIDTGEVYPVTINARGFRGPEFTDEKPAGVVRIVTLGASSTFGYHARDDQTYPAQLQRVLEAACPTRQFEVVNLAIPHLTSTQILALFAAEGAPLHPDVVTFYEGFNDANDLDGKAESSPASPTARDASRHWTKFVGRWLREHFLLGALADALAANWMHRYSAAEISAHIERSRRVFLENLARLVRTSAGEGFIPIFATQQSRSLLVPREKIRGVTFQQELDMVSAELERRGWLGRKEAAFYTHGALLEAEERWAREQGVTLVDVRRALDRQRDTVVSWVHLSREGNRIVAEQLAAPILARTCPGFNGADVATRPSERPAR